jgi:hypothetical protein
MDSGTPKVDWDEVLEDIHREKPKNSPVVLTEEQAKEQGMFD